MKRLYLILLIILIHNSVFAQSLEKYGFKIYLGSAAAADVNVRINSDSTYKINAIRFLCSLCEMEELAKAINQQGNWRVKEDTIYLYPSDTNVVWKMQVLDDKTLKPLFLVNTSFYKIPNDTIRNRIIESSLKSSLSNFNLIYETYDNGVVKEATWGNRYRKNKYKVFFSRNGEIIRIEKYKNKKKKILK